MNVRPEVTRNPKIVDLVDELGLEVGWYLLCIWGHCQESRKGGNWGPVKDHYIERVCAWTGKRGELYKALSSSNSGERGVIYRDEDGNLIIHDWEKENAGLIQKWNANKGGRNQHSGTKSGRKQPTGRQEDGGRSSDHQPTGRQKDGEEVGNTDGNTDGGEDGARSIRLDRTREDRNGLERKEEGEGADAPARPDAPPAVRLSWEDCHALWSKDPGCSEKLARAVWLSLEADKLPCGSWRKVRSGDRKDERVGDARTAFLSRLSAKMADAEERKKPEKKRAGQSWGREKLPPKIL